MAGSVNKVILVGNLGADPDVRTLQDGTKLVNLSVATSETWRNKDGERQERTEWHRVVVFNERLADVAERYLRKGSKIYLEGALQTRSYEDRDGVKKYVTEIVLQRYRGELTMLDGKSEGQGTQNVQNEQNVQSVQSAQPPTSGSNAAMAGGEIEDDIPFAPEVR